MRARSLTLNGLRIDHMAGSGPAMLFVHGSHTGAWCWSNFLPYFARLGYDVYALSLRGHAPNPPLAELGRLSLLDYAADVVGVMAEIGRQPVLVGHSLGAAVAQLAAAEREPLALVLASAAPLGGVRFRRPRLGLRGGLSVLRSLPAVMAGKPLQPDYFLNMHGVFNKMPAEAGEAMYRRLGPESSTALLELFRGRHHANLSAAPFPRLVISGNDDAMLVMAMQRELAAHIDADLIELPGHGHAFMVEPGWEGCAARLADWLGERLTVDAGAAPGQAG